jgi:hypothetical protein
MMLNTSTKVRTTKDGKRFLVIPLRHNTPGNVALAPAMPTSVYELASEMKPSEVTSIGVRPAGQLTLLSPTSGMTPAAVSPPFLSSIGSKKTYMVANANYAWGGRLTRANMMAAGIGAKERKLYAGMMRMKEATGGSSYLVFRTMMEGSTGWVTKAKPGLNIVQKVVSQLQPLATAAIGEAMKRMSES